MAIRRRACSLAAACDLKLSRREALDHQRNPGSHNRDGTSESCLHFAGNTGRRRHEDPGQTNSTMSAISTDLLVGLPFVVGLIVGYAIRSLISQLRRARAARYRATRD